MTRVSFSGRRPPGRLPAAVVLVVALTGCVRKAEFVLRQPFAPPAQQNLRLVSDSVFRASSGEREIYTLSFPLPGAVDGPRTFVVYLSAPQHKGKLLVAPDSPEGVRGFLIQEVGALAGRCDFVAGTLQVQNVFLAPRLKRLTVQLRTDDGAELVGQAVVEDLPRAVQSFEREFAADIKTLAPPAAQPTEDQPSTDAACVEEQPADVASAPP